uniref:Uncharacterized protein n=1 Tax=viral metagenome TaxID=1070528 RepID=A0A6C0E5I8_9ZZZZ
MNVIYICKTNYKYKTMEQPTQFCQHPNSAFTRMRQRSVSHSNIDNSITNPIQPDVVSKSLSARQIAFREIKKLFGAATNSKSVHPKK